MGHSDLPLANYDGLPIGGLTHRVRTLDYDAVATLVDYESHHANRPAVIELLNHRLEELRRGATPSDGSPEAAQPEHTTSPAPATDQARPETEGPAVNPPSHGVPTNPSQPRSGT
jgi:hypothetical protein